MNFKGIIFDMDGTLTVPMIDFAAIRKQLNIVSGDMMAEIESWPEARREMAWRLVEKYEKDVRDKTQLQPGCKEALVKFRNSGIRLGILTRNSQESVDRFLEIIDLVFDAVLTREYAHVKPSPVPVLDIASIWSVNVEDVLMVGDFIHDIECGKAAGTATCFFANPGYESYADFADYSVESFLELEKVVLIPDFFSKK